MDDDRGSLNACHVAEEHFACACMRSMRRIPASWEVRLVCRFHVAAATSFGAHRACMPHAPSMQDEGSGACSTAANAGQGKIGQAGSRQQLPQVSCWLVARILKQPANAAPLCGVRDQYNRVQAAGSSAGSHCPQGPLSGSQVPAPHQRRAPPAAAQMQAAAHCCAAAGCSSPPCAASTLSCQ